MHYSIYTKAESQNEILVKKLMSSIQFELNKYNESKDDHVFLIENKDSLLKDISLLEYDFTLKFVSFNENYYLNEVEKKLFKLLQMYPENKKEFLSIMALFTETQILH